MNIQQYASKSQESKVIEHNAKYWALWEWSAARELVRCFEVFQHKQLD